MTPGHCEGTEDPHHDKRHCQERNVCRDNTVEFIIVGLLGVELQDEPVTGVDTCL